MPATPAGRRPSARVRGPQLPPLPLPLLELQAAAAGSAAATASGARWPSALPCAARRPLPAVHMRPALPPMLASQCVRGVGETSPIRYRCRSCIRTRRPQATVRVQSAALRSILTAYLLCLCCQCHQRYRATA